MPPSQVQQRGGLRQHAVAQRDCRGRNPQLVKHSRDSGAVDLNHSVDDLESTTQDQSEGQSDARVRARPQVGNPAKD